MELKCKINGYHAGFGSLNEGDTTADFEISEEIKAQMLDDHPEWFEVCEGKVPEKVVEAVIDTPEDVLTIETPEGKMPKTRKK